MVIGLVINVVSKNCVSIINNFATFSELLPFCLIPFHDGGTGNGIVLLNF